MNQILIQNKGHTLLSVLFSLSIVLLITPMIIYLIKPIVNIKDISYFPHFEMSQFKFFIQNELNNASTIEIDDHVIHFNRADGSTVSFEKYVDQIRRRVNHSGHEILLRNIRQFMISQMDENYFKIFIVRGDGYEQNFYFYFKNKIK